MSERPALDWTWSYSLGSAVRGLTWAREAELLLARTANQNVALFNSRGEIQAQTQLPGLTSAAISDTGDAIVAVGSAQVWWLAPDLQPIKELGLPAPAVAVAVEPYGRFVAVSDRKGIIHLLDAAGRRLGRIACPRPAYHLAFVPTEPHLVAAADLGWVGLLDIQKADWAWSDRPVSNIGALSVAGNGEPIVMACFSEGVRRYDMRGPRTSRAMPSPCGLVTLSFSGSRGVAAGQAASLFAFDAKGDVVATQELRQPPTALALDAGGDRIFIGLGDGAVQHARLSWNI